MTITVIDLISAIATVLSVGGNVLLAKKIIYVFPIWIIADVLLIGIVWVQSQNISMITMYAIYIGTAIYSWISWKKEEKKSE